MLQHRFSSFAGQRNWALEQGELRHAWVLMLDADEAMTPAAMAAVDEAVRKADPLAAAFVMCRRTGSSAVSSAMSMAIRSGSCARASRPGPLPRLGAWRGAAASRRGERGKNPRALSALPLRPWVEPLGGPAQRLFDEGSPTELDDRSPWSWREVFGRDATARRRSLRNLARRVPFRPLLRFGYHYFWKWGFLDGRAGFAYSVLMAYYEALIVLKGWERTIPEPPKK